MIRNLSKQSFEASQIISHHKWPFLLLKLNAVLNGQRVDVDHCALGTGQTAHHHLWAKRFRTLSLQREFISLYSKRAAVTFLQHLFGLWTNKSDARVVKSLKGAIFVAQPHSMTNSLGWLTLCPACKLITAALMFCLFSKLAIQPPEFHYTTLTLDALRM